MSVAPSVALALAQLRYQRTRWALLACGVALIVAVPVVTAGLTRSVTADSVRQLVAGLDLSDRTLLVSQEASSTFRVTTPQQADVAVRAQLARLSTTPARHELLYREISADGATFYLTATDGLADAVTLTSGRLPRSCTPTRCEVLAIGADQATMQPGAASIGVIVVGTATRRDPLLISGSLDPDGRPVLVGADIDALAQLESLQLFARYYAWVTAIDADRIVSLGVNAYLARSADVNERLSQTVGATSFARPDDQVKQVSDRAQVSARRFRLLGGFAAVLMLGFAVIVGAGLRREVGLLSAVLRRRGATPGQLLACVATASAACVLAGMVLGALIGGVAAAGWWQGGTGLSPLGAALSAAGSAAAVATLLALLAGIVVIAVLLWPDARAGAVWRTLDLVAVASLGAAALAAARGSASTAAVLGGDPFVIALPVLASIVAGVLAARLWSPALRLAQRLLPHRSIASRVALLGLLRRPLRPAATVAFLTASVASVVFSGAYRATLFAGDADQAAYQVPLDVTLSASQSQGVVSRVVDPAAVRAAGGQAYGVLRANASVVRLAGVTDTVTVVAVDDGALSRARRWERTAGGTSGAELTRLLGSHRTIAAPVVPAGTTQLSLAADGVDPQTVLTLWLRDAQGAEQAVSLRSVHGQLVGDLSSGASGPLTAVAFGVDEAPDYATHHAHAIGEGTTDQPLLSGRITLGSVSADGHTLGWNWSSWGSAQGTVDATSAALRLGYRLAGSPVIAVPGLAALTGLQIPIVVDRTTAQDASGGVLPFMLDASTPLTGRIVATLPRLPTVSGPFILADRGALEQLLDTMRPGRAASEFWLSGSTPALDRLLAAPPYSELTITRRAQLQAQLDRDPVGRGSRLLLAIVALLALGIAAVSLVMLVVGERRDGAGEAFAWEADGMSPAVLRRMLALRALAAALVSVPIGIVAGLVVARVGATLVSVDAAGSAPTPPLSVTLGSAWTPLALALGLGAGVAVACLVAVRSLRERFPVPAPVDLR